MLAAADPLTAGTDPGQATTTVSRRSLLADNANLHEHPAASSGASTTSKPACPNRLITEINHP